MTRLGLQARRPEGRAMQGRPEPLPTQPPSDEGFIWLAANRPGMYWLVTSAGWFVCVAPAVLLVVTLIKY
jgi:hypothetical protein